MKLIDRDFLLNPINRDLILVIAAGMIIAVAIMSFLAMMVSQF